MKGRGVPDTALDVLRPFVVGLLESSPRKRPMRNSNDAMLFFTKMWASVVSDANLEKEGLVDAVSPTPSSVIPLLFV